METKHQSGSYCLGPAGTQTNIVRPIWSQEESKSEVPLSYLYWDIRINKWITHLWSVKNIVILAATCSTLDKNLKLQHIWNNLLHPKLTKQICHRLLLDFILKPLKLQESSRATVSQSSLKCLLFQKATKSSDVTLEVIVILVAAIIQHDHKPFTDCLMNTTCINGIIWQNYVSIWMAGFYTIVRCQGAQFYHFEVFTRYQTDTMSASKELVQDSANFALWYWILKDI